ncbi:MAG: RNA 2',3'-cyclic phosphodiesterase, partial [Pyrinomonadaceae bacterium]
MTISEDQEKLLRLFFAVELPSEVRERVAEHIARLQGNESGRGARWERAEKLHLTLKFLGETPAARVENLASAARRVTKDFAPFELSVAGTGSFPPRGAARVLWLGIEDGSGKLAALQRRLEDELAGEGFA